VLDSLVRVTRRVDEGRTARTTGREETRDPSATVNPTHSKLVIGPTATVNHAAPPEASPFARRRLGGSHGIGRTYNAGNDPGGPPPPPRPDPFTAETAGAGAAHRESGCPGLTPTRRRPRRAARADRGQVPGLTGSRRAARRPPSLPSRQFQALLTLFSKFFASFPRGTCSLSVSRPYLALRGTYRAIGAILPNNPTLQAGGAVGLQGGYARGSHPPRRPFPGDLHRPAARRSPVVRPQFGQTRACRILGLGSSRFTRSYWGNPGWFLLLRLFICLNSAGDVA